MQRLAFLLRQPYSQKHTPGHSTDLFRIIEQPGLEYTGCPVKFSLIFDKDGSGVVQKDYIYFGDRPAAMATTTGTPAVCYYHVDHLNTPQLLTSQSGAAARSADYEVFGEVDLTVSTVESNLRFPGQYFDGETQLHYNYFRDYDGSLGRYVQSDSIGINGLYKFVYRWFCILFGRIRQMIAEEDCDKFSFAHRITTSESQNEADKKKAFQVWEELSEKGYIRSTFYLGVCYDVGIGTRKNDRKAYCNYLLAAELGHVEAQYNVYKMLYDGVGVDKNIDESIEWLKVAALGNKDIEAIRDLGFCYYMGRGVKKNYKLAVKYYRVAAKKGDSKAQWNFGLCYEYGDGVQASKRWSNYWFDKAANQGHEGAMKKMKYTG